MSVSAAGVAVLQCMLQPIQQYLDDPEVVEISVVRPGEFIVERAGRKICVECPDLDFERQLSIAIVGAYVSGKDLNSDYPTCVARLPAGERIRSSIHPAVGQGTVGLSVRNRAKAFTPTLRWMAEHDFYADLEPHQDWVEYFERVIADPDRGRPVGIVVSGPFGSGKTTMAEAMLNSIHPDRRIVTLEASSELRLLHRNWQAFFFDESKKDSAEIMVAAAKNASPEWFPFQELRGGEAWAYFNAVKTGVSWITTAHAADGIKVLSTIASMIMQHESARAMSFDEIVFQLRQYVTHIVQCAKIEDGESVKYRAVEVIEVGPTEQEDRYVGRVGRDF